MEVTKGCKHWVNTCLCVKWKAKSGSSSCISDPHGSDCRLQRHAHTHGRLYFQQTNTLQQPLLGHPPAFSIELFCVFFFCLFFFIPGKTHSEVLTKSQSIIPLSKCHSQLMHFSHVNTGIRWHFTELNCSSCVCLGSYIRIGHGGGIAINVIPNTEYAGRRR